MIKYLDLKSINALYTEDIRQSIDEVLESGWYLKGEATRRFEQHYAHYIGTGHCVACGNGLDALALILRAYIEMRVMEPGDEVIVPANTFIASVLAISANQLVPIFVEPNPETLQLDDSLIEQAITPRTRAIMLVHLYGRCAFNQRIADICKRYRLKLIEDNAQAHGCKYVENSVSAKLRRTGSLGDAAGHSFYPGKNLGALGDAGAVTTDDEQLASVIRAIGNYGSCEKYVHDYFGRNSRMDEIQAAVLDCKLSHLDQDNARRREIANAYFEGINNPQIHIPRSLSDSVLHIFPVFCKKRDQLKNYLMEKGIETQIHYPIPPHKQRCYSCWNHLNLPVSERLASEELSIPCHQAMNDAEVQQVIDALNCF